MLIVSWFADGPKWENILLAPFYSQGLTYFRPFRYRDEWISVELLTQLEQSTSEVTKSSKEEGTLLCAKFLDSEVLIPIRQIEITHVCQHGEEYYLYFRLGRFVNYRTASSLLEYTPILKNVVKAEDRQKLFHKSLINISALSFVQEYDPAAENESWTRFVDFLCESKDLPLKQVRESVFFKLAGLRKQRKAESLTPVLIGQTSLEGDIYGFELKEGESYELEILHRIPSLIGTNFRVTPFEYHVSLPEEFFEVAPGQEEVSGNYQPHVFLLQARRATPRQSLHFKAPTTKSAAYEGGVLQLEDFRIPIRNRFSLVKWFKVWGVPSLVLFAGIFIGLLADAAMQEGWKDAFLSIPTIWKAIGSFALIVGINWMRWRS